MNAHADAVHRAVVEVEVGVAHALAQLQRGIQSARAPVQVLLSLSLRARSVPGIKKIHLKVKSELKDENVILNLI